MIKIQIRAYSVEILCFFFTVNNCAVIIYNCDLKINSGSCRVFFNDIRNPNERSVLSGRVHGTSGQYLVLSVGKNTHGRNTAEVTYIINPESTH